MNYPELIALRDRYNAKKAAMGALERENYERAFAIEYAHNSTAIEGNTLTLIEAKLVLEDGIAVGGKPLREIYELTNHDKAYSYIIKTIAEGKPLTESITKDIHAILTENILVGGVYRDVDVRITGAAHKPPPPSLMYTEIKAFFSDLPKMQERLNTVQLAAYTHAEFVKIHPFPDGNGRASRLIMNYQLMRDAFPAIDIKAKDRLSYYNALECYAVNGDISPFEDMIAEVLEEKMRAF
ncbi:MAG: Fic family protein [Ruminococcus sp.]|jgi:Fic family protein|nr:Fic family protein [Ruminococcus sp.]